MNKSALQKILFQLIKFKSETRNQAEVKRAVDYVGTLFRGTQYGVKKFAHKGVHSLIIFPTRSDWRYPKILLNGHIDVVPAHDMAQFKPYEKNGRIYGRGAVDMKGGLTALIGTLLELDAQKIKSDVGLMITGDEEVGGAHGAGFLVDDMGLRPQFAIAGDAPRRSGVAITIHGKGGVWVELTARGKSAHAARPWLGENALDKLHDAIAKIKRTVEKRVPSDSWETTVTLSVIETDNQAPNIVPSYARGVIDIRFTETFAVHPDDAHRKLKAMVPEVQVTALTKVMPLINDSKNSFIRDIQSSFSHTFGEKIPLVREHGASDARHFMTYKIPSILVGTIGDNWHTKDEWVSMDSIMLLKDALFAYLKKHAT
ncbi:MAG: M20/M25/M40 family metallo-hydrolase [Patescibacteria group bacterium]|nr:M20/M25/M40 family metallo-hydrolase [Patescibacteria group bacterium]